MYKKLIASGSALMLALLVVSTSAFAATAAAGPENQQKAIQLIEQANREIDQKIQTAVQEAEELQANYLTEAKEIQDNENEPAKDSLLAERTAEYTKVLNEIISTLYNETLEISSEAIRQAAELGVKAECSWVLVKLADQSVWIDPIAVTI